MLDSKFEHLPYSSLTSQILKASFDVAKELGYGFLEKVYQNALIIALKKRKLFLEIEKGFEVYFQGERVGIYIADLVVNPIVIVELKCCKNLTGEHQAQVINYLAASKLPIGILINFGNRTLEYKRLYNPSCRRDSIDPAGEADPVFPS